MDTFHRLGAARAALQDRLDIAQRSAQYHGERVAPDGADLVDPSPDQLGRLGRGRGRPGADWLDERGHRR